METNDVPPPVGNPPDSSGDGNVDLGAAKKRKPYGPRKTKSGENRGADETFSELDAAFLSDAVVYFFETADELCARAALARVQKLFPAKVAEFEELQRQVGLNTRDKDLIKKCVARIAQKYALISRFAPEILLAGVALQYTLRQSRLFSAIDKLEKAVTVPAEVKTVK